MKSIRPTTAKTRKGVIAWLAKHNPFLQTERLYHHAEIVAVHIHRYTAALVSYELEDGTLLSAHSWLVKAQLNKAA